MIFDKHQFVTCINSYKPLAKINISPNNELIMESYKKNKLWTKKK